MITKNQRDAVSPASGVLINVVEDETSLNLSEKSRHDDDLSEHVAFVAPAEKGAPVSAKLTQKLNETARNIM